MLVPVIQSVESGAAVVPLEAMDKRSQGCEEDRKWQKFVTPNTERDPVKGHLRLSPPALEFGSHRLPLTCKTASMSSGELKPCPTHSSIGPIKPWPNCPPISQR